MEEGGLPTPGWGGVLRQESKYLGSLFASEGWMEREINRQIGAESAVMRMLNIAKRELSQKVKLWIYRSIYVPTTDCL